MVVDILNQLLIDYSVKRDFFNDLREEYRKPLENDLNEIFVVKPNYRYGGSLAKYTANSNSSDMDLLCYFDYDYQASLKEIYNTTYDALVKKNYICQKKNSAIYVSGKIGEPEWDITVDVVPGKYTANENNKDVYLWCNKDNARLKSNPEVQIEKISSSKSKEVIRIVKLFREFNNFKFKSFFLEIFAVDVIEPEYEDGDSVYDKLVKFCSHYDEIGKKRIYDPANDNNDIMKIHDEFEFQIIRQNIKKFYDALLTNDSDTIINCIKGHQYDLESGYDRNAYEHAPEIKVNNYAIALYSAVSLTGYYLEEGEYHKFDSNTILHKKTELRFEIHVSLGIQLKSVKLIVSNSGYEALHANCLRGGKEDTKYEKKHNSVIYVREETTSYVGNHCVQAVVVTIRDRIMYSDILRVKVR